MSIEGYNLTRLSSSPVVKRSNLRQALLFIVPSLVITGISIILFHLLTGFTQPQLNHLLITLFTAIIVSLIAAAGVQLLVYRIIEDREHFFDAPASRGLKVGILGSAVLSLILLSMLLRHYVVVLNFTYTDFVFIVIITLYYSATWVITSAFWASDRYFYPTIIFIIGYLGIFAFTYGAYRIDPGYTIVGYTVGTGFLLLISCLGAIKAFPRPLVSPKLWTDLSIVRRLASQNKLVIFLSIILVLAVFIDKIIVWIAQGQASGQGLTIPGYYTVGSFLGLVPMLSVAVVAYFSSKTKIMVDDRYQGTMKEIRKRTRDYKFQYGKSTVILFTLAFILMVSVLFLSYLFIADSRVLLILVTIASGSIFFSGIIFNTMVFPLFGKNSVSVFAVMVVIIFVLVTYPFLNLTAWYSTQGALIARVYDITSTSIYPIVEPNVWYSSLGFLIGSFLGWFISTLNILRLFSRFEFNMFRLLLK